jgi:hypothetical protein
MKTAYFTIKNKELVNKFTVKKAFDLEDGNYELTIRKKNRRSLPQNNFFHSILPDIQKALYDAGWRNIKTPDQAKRMVKELFLTVEVENEVTGEKMKEVRSTSSLNKKEMGEFLDEVIQWAAEYLSLTIYSPNEQSAFNY